MATIANLQIDLSARTARFSEGLQRAQQRVQQFSQRVQVDLQRVTQVGQRAALVFSGMAAGLTVLTRNAGQYAGQIKDAADQTGLAYRSMQELSFAASQSAADFQTLMSGLRAFVRRTAEAAAGNTSFLKGFERLGFTQEQVRAGLQDIDGFLMQVADRVAELGTTAEQSAVLMTIMGDAGRRLVPFMAQGARGIRELREQARELGLVMDEQAIHRLAAFNDRVAVLRERSAAAGREMAVWFLPVMEAGVGLFEDIIGAIQDIDPALRAHAVRWTVVVGAVLGVVGVLGVLGTAVSQAGALLGTFGRLVVFAFSPFFIQAALVGGAVALAITHWDELVEWWRNTQFGQLAMQMFDDIRDTWAREDLTLPEKVVETVRITVRTVADLIESINAWWLGVVLELSRRGAVLLGLDPDTAWLPSLLSDLRDIWADADLTFPEKVIQSVRITVGAVLGLVESVVDWFLNAAIDLTRDVAVALGIDWQNSRLGQLVDQIQEWWNREDITLAEKALGVVAVSAAISWVLAFARPFVEELAKQSGLAKATGEAARAGARWAVSLGRLAVFGYLAWYFLPVDIKERAADVWNQVGTALREWNDETLGNPFVDRIGRWLQELSAHDWETGALTVGVVFAAFHALQAGAVIASKLGAAIAAALLSAEVAIPLALASLPFAITAWGIFSMEEGARKELLDKIQAVLGDETLKPYLKIKEIILLLEENVWESMRASFIEGLKQHPVLGPAINFADMTINLSRLLGAAFRLRWNIFGGRGDEAAPGLEQPLERVRDAAEEAKGAVDGLSSSLQRLEAVTGFSGMAAILEAIYRAEGGPRARVPYGMTGFEEMGRRFAREINQQRFEEILAATGIQEGSEDFFAAAAAVSVLHYWDTFKQQFPEVGARTFAELEPALQRLFIEHMGRGFAPPSAHRLNVNWVPNVTGILGITGGGSFQSGTPWTGWGPTDEVAGVVHRREAVIPWDVLRRGPAAVLEFLGAPGFQAGYVPAAFGGLTGAAFAQPDPGFLARLVESVIGGLESRGIIDPETARGLRELTDNLLGVVSGLYDRAKELWDQLGQFDLGEYIDQARRFREELEALGDVAEQERLAILDRIERLDELVEIERLVAQATGQAFDETRFRAQELSRAITQVARQMFEAGDSVETVAATIAPWVEQLEPLQRQLEAQDAAATALERLAVRLSEVDAGLAALVRSLRWELGRGFRLDTAGLIQSAIGLAVDLIVDLFGSGAQELRRRLADVPDPGQDILSIADTFRRYSSLERNIAERQRLLQDLYRQQRAITTRTAGGAAIGGILGFLVGGPIGAAIGGILGGAVGRASAERDLRPQIEATERQIRELEAQIQGAITDLIQALGIAADDFAAGIAAAFQEADITGFSERLRESVRDTVRQALIQAFVAQVLEPQITALAEMVQDAFLRGAPLDMAAIDAQIESIVDVSAQLYDRFEQLGLTVERANEAMSRFVRNIPSGYRVERALFEVSPPRIPALAAGGIVTRPTLALVGEAGPEAVVPLDGREFGTVNITIQRMEVQDGRDFGRRLDEELRRRGLVRAGNVTAWGGRR